jgi:hypothetical protein
LLRTLTFWPGERQLTFDEVVVRVRDDFALEFHIDTEEANAAGLAVSGGHHHQYRRPQALQNPRNYTFNLFVGHGEPPLA